MNSAYFMLLVAVAVSTVKGHGVHSVLNTPSSSQYHTQDDLGQYSYGYSSDLSSKQEQRSADGVTRGGYSYVDANGIVQSVAYISDPINGFRASGTNFPIDNSAAVIPGPVPALPAVTHTALPSIETAESPAVIDVRRLDTVPAPAVVLSAPNVRLHQALTPAGTSNLHYSPSHSSLLLGRRKRSLYYSVAPVPAHVVSVKHAAVPLYGATSYTSVVRHDPIKYAAIPVVDHYPAPLVQHYPVVIPAVKQYPVPIVPAPSASLPAVNSQYHSQDEYGQYVYGYTDGFSAKNEVRNADGETKGSYSYVDDNGHLQAVQYTAGHEGFKASGTTIPVHHV
ncbi:uncharacterized protein LOC126903267 [Daktulosphaira vitifoliae]|uniref:uncharacterized protein LOC126903267 n=1 Tax=Daktulosphaira vitifoliae TaxID=58002 RepID=UPI0021AA2DF3|nr:uncharacterized protein LOC126903267 [Daktulosphaira vitifoliae]